MSTRRPLFPSGPRGGPYWAAGANDPWQARPQQPRAVHAKFVGGPRHGQTHELAPKPPTTIHVPTPEGTDLYVRREVGEAEPWPDPVIYHYQGILKGSDEPDEVGMRLVAALSSVATHVTEKTALRPGSIMLPDSVLPGATKVMGLEVVRGDRVALLLELM